LGWWKGEKNLGDNVAGKGRPSFKSVVGGHSVPCAKNKLSPPKQKELT